MQDSAQKWDLSSARRVSGISLEMVHVRGIGDFHAPPEHAHPEEKTACVSRFERSSVPPGTGRSERIESLR